ncbi:MULTISPECIES: family 16 glycosylhydrolase [Acidovorax]|uniref:Beta-glucanase n=1 Tax=Acidovorax facilis TaxID=12917 RepID=A0ABV8DH13_9BURK|nr:MULTISPECIES: family 16 glycosylhydrolase [Acidovorax]MBO1011532.1 family 16 glycosylhydrolase [Acidovorax sp. SD340]MCO4245494.1 family 16 glycosylhydrolase [Acidovorax facilis]
MNLTRPPQVAFRQILRLVHGIRKMLPKQTSHSFGNRRIPHGQTIEKIYVINLDREPGRWLRIKQELRRIRDRLGNDLLDLTERYAAVDARDFLHNPSVDADVDPYYTLADQLFVEPQPQTLPTRFDLDARIQMTRAEVAVARSHIEVWRRIACGEQTHALILEDDVWFHPGFARHIDQAWKDVVAESNEHEDVDVIYVSYLEARHGAPKTFVSSAVFRPVRGLWHLSGYILSRQGAQRLLRLLPCRGPVDLWINHQFSVLNVRATRRSLVRQRTDTASTNSYSILPTLSTIGAINSEGAALFKVRPTQLPVFAFGPAISGQSSLAIALSMLGYRCCSDLDSLPSFELTRLLEGSVERVFNAYVNVGCLESMVGELRRLYPQAKFIVTAALADGATPTSWSVPAVLEGADVVVLDTRSAHAWRILCEHLRCAPPSCSFPWVNELGQRHIVEADVLPEFASGGQAPKRDQSPWVVECGHSGWRGVQVAPPEHASEIKWSANDEHSGRLDRRHWSARTDTFTGNLALFRPSNVEFDSTEGVTIHVRKEELGVRQYSAGALTSHDHYLFGRFEATFEASNVPGLVTGFFLHRNSPHQEIDIEIAGNMPTRLVVNVFYNPGGEGAPFDYGYRGAPSHIELGFDASKGLHRYAIEWTPCEIRWLVDDRLVHRRVLWNPTPIPHLPMKLHVNTWPSRSNQLAGRLHPRLLPARTYVQSIRVTAHGSPLIERQAETCSTPVEALFIGDIS